MKKVSQQFQSDRGLKTINEFLGDTKAFDGNAAYVQAGIYAELQRQRMITESLVNQLTSNNNLEVLIQYLKSREYNHG